MTTTPTYAFQPRVLRRWRDERLTLTQAPDGAMAASFRFDGSTCGNIPFVLWYSVRLAPAAERYRIIDLGCEPAGADEGHRRMCSYLEGADRLLVTLRTERPLVGQPLAEALAWRPATSPAGCVCAAASRNHKWLAVLHTLHFALHEPSTVFSTP
ncbi:MAG TPA: hypothetical protein VHE61_19640 [Opitutaceae bacterium]|nr:hypothetical protein [Opitutaceae bacterium]